jgi:hypothetical protein
MRYVMRSYRLELSTEHEATLRGGAPLTGIKRYLEKQKNV